MICQRPAHKARGLLWEFVGCKVEPGETKEQALILEGTPQKLEHNGIRWITVDELDQYAGIHHPCHLIVLLVK